MKRDTFFTSCHFFIGECNLARFPMLKIFTEKISGFSHIVKLLKLPSNQDFFRNLRFQFGPFLP